MRQCGKDMELEEITVNEPGSHTVKSKNMKNEAGLSGDALSHQEDEKNINAINHEHIELEQNIQNIDWSSVVKTLLPSRGRSSRNFRLDGKFNDVSHFITLPKKTRNSLDCHIANKLRRTLNEMASRDRSKIRRHSFDEFTLNESSQTNQLEMDNRLDFTENEQVPVDPRLLAIPMAEKRKYKNHMIGNSELAQMASRIKIERQQLSQKFKDLWNRITSPFIFWHRDLKKIEGHYGTGVASYFLFLRWMLCLNLLITVIVIGFVVVPEIIFRIKDPGDRSANNSSKSIQKNIYYSNKNFFNYNISELLPFVIQLNMNLPLTRNKTSLEIIYDCSSNYTKSIEPHNETVLDVIQHTAQGTGWMELTPMFIGWYKPYEMRDSSEMKSYYNLPIAYIFVTIFSFLLCLILMVIYTKKSIRENVLKDEDHLQKYCNMIFSGWDFSIEVKKLAEIKHNELLQKIKVHLIETRRKAEISNWSTKKKVMITIIRIVINFIVIILLCAAGFLIYWSTDYSFNQMVFYRHAKGPEALLKEYLPSLTITGLNIILPVMFNFLATFERYSVSFNIKISIIRCVFTRIASICILIASFHTQIACDPKTVCGVGYNDCQAPMCWETYVGQQLYKLVILDFVVVILLIFLVGYPRKLIVTNFSFKIIQFIGREEFDISQNVLALVYSQTLCWLGLFYSPFLPLMSMIKYFLYFYARKFSLFVNCGPSKELYRASRTNTFFMIVLTLSYLIGLFPVIYSIAELKTSKGCSPFRFYETAWETMIYFVGSLPVWIGQIINLIASAAFAIPLFIILCLFLYYYLTISAAYCQMSGILKEHLMSEGRDKRFLLTKLMIALRKQDG